jgi:hypothetical protein
MLYCKLKWHRSVCIATGATTIDCPTLETRQSNSDQNIDRCHRPDCVNPKIYSSEFLYELRCTANMSNDDESHVARCHKTCLKMWLKAFRVDALGNLACPLADCKGFIRAQYVVVVVVVDMYVSLLNFFIIIFRILLRVKEDGERVIKETEEIEVKDAEVERVKKELAEAKAKAVR